MPVRVLIAEDMQTTYYMLRMLLEQAGGLEVVGWAKDGEEVVHLVAELVPDIVTMDIQMPKQSGLMAIREIMASTPVPIVVISSHANDASMDLAFHALNEGALDVMGKPPAITDPSFALYASDLCAKLRAMSEIKVIRRRRPKESMSPARCAPPTSSPSSVEVVALGTSAGGPQVLSSILRALPAGYPHPVLIVQHIVEGFMEGMAAWLDQQCPLRVKVAEGGERLQPGTIYFAPDHRHLRIDRRDGYLLATTDDSEPVDGFKPSVNIMLESVAKVCGRNAIGGILTGMGSDGARGLLAMARQGAITFVQDEQTSLIYGMPKAALDLGAASQPMPLEEIPRFLCETSAAALRLPG